MATVVSLDIGTSKLCALALKTETLEPLVVYSIPNGSEVANLSKGCDEQDPTRLRERILDLLAELLADKAVQREDVVGIGIAGQMHGVLLVDQQLRPATNLITWRDRRVLQAEKPGCLEEAQQAANAAGPRRTGCRLHTGYGGATLYHLARNGGLPTNATAMTIADYVAACLTGVVATEPTHAASWGLLDLETRQWDRELVQRLLLPPEILPPILSTPTDLAPIRDDLAHSLGLPHNVRVCVPIGDNQASILGVTGFARDIAVVNFGTSGQVSIFQHEPVVVEGFETRPMPFGGYVLVGSSLCGGWSYTYLRRFAQEVARQFTGVELDDAITYERLNRLAAGAAPGADGLVVDPYFDGKRSDPNLRGVVRGIDSGNLTPGNLARAFIEGMVRELADLYHAADTTGVTQIAVSGNAARANDLVAETIESLFGRKCYKSRHPEEAAFGAAHAAAVTLRAGALPVARERHSAHLIRPPKRITTRLRQNK